MQGWHDENGADYEPVGHWRRAYCYRRGAETRAQAVEREILQTRKSLGLLDASTLGKLVVKGPDAGKFLGYDVHQYDEQSGRRQMPLWVDVL